VGIHEGLELVLLLELVAGRESLLLLLLVEHHLLDGGARLGVEVAELGVLRLDLLGVDLGVALDDAVPPVHAVHLGEGHLEGALVTILLEGPERLGHLDLLVEGPVDDGGLALDRDLEGLALHDDVELLGKDVVREGHVESHLLEGLGPPVAVGLAAVARVGLLALVLGLLGLVGRVALLHGRVLLLLLLVLG
jgi:hypothetical protein